jgi:hypothetical protein
MSSFPPFSASVPGVISSLPAQDDVALLPADHESSLWVTPSAYEPKLVVSGLQLDQGSYTESKRETIDSGIIFAPQYPQPKEELGLDEKVIQVEPTFDDFSLWQPTEDLMQMILSDDSSASGLNIRLDDEIYINANKASALSVFGVHSLMI